MTTDTTSLDYWLTRQTTYPGGPMAWIADTEATLQAPYRTQILDAIRPYAPTSVYEVGCHMGMNLVRVREMDPTVRVGGCDINSLALFQASQRLSGGVVSTHFQLGEAEHLVPYWGTRSWDVVLSCYTLCYLAPERAQRVVEGMRRMANKAVIIAEPDESAPEHEREFRHNYRAWLPGVVESALIDPPVESLNHLWVWEKP